MIAEDAPLSEAISNFLTKGSTFSKAGCVPVKTSELVLELYNSIKKIYLDENGYLDINREKVKSLKSKYDLIIKKKESEKTSKTKKK